MIQIAETVPIHYGRLALKMMAVARILLGFNFPIPRKKLLYPCRRQPSSAEVHLRAPKREMLVRNILMLPQQHPALQLFRPAKVDCLPT